MFFTLVGALIGAMFGQALADLVRQYDRMAEPDHYAILARSDAQRDHRRWTKFD